MVDECEEPVEKEMIVDPEVLRLCSPMALLLPWLHE